MAGFKHLIECHCYLSIFKNKEKITNHRFPVYSKVDYLGNVKAKIVKCNNCEAMHRVYSFGKSEIIPGKDDSNIVSSLEDLKYLQELQLDSLVMSQLQYQKSIKDQDMMK